MSEMDKKKALFEALDQAEKSLNKLPRPSTQNDEDMSRRRGDRHQSQKIEKYKNKNSIFKRPALPLQKCLAPRSRPRYELNPEKYTKYSLSDVTDLSDSSNKYAAFQFLKEMEDRNNSNEDSTSRSSEEKIVFKKSAKLKAKDDEPNQSEKRVQGNKFLMAEYVVGEKKKSKSEKKRSFDQKISNVKSLKLSHLDDDPEEED